MLKVGNLSEDMIANIEEAVAFYHNGDPVKDVMDEGDVIECMVALHDILIAQKQKEAE